MWKQFHSCKQKWDRRDADFKGPRREREREGGGVCQEGWIRLETRCAMCAYLAAFKYSVPLNMNCNGKVTCCNVTKYSYLSVSISCYLYCISEVNVVCFCTILLYQCIKYDALLYMNLSNKIIIKWLKSFLCVMTTNFADNTYALYLCKLLNWIYLQWSIFTLLYCYFHLSKICEYFFHHWQAVTNTKLNRF